MEKKCRKDTPQSIRNQGWAEFHQAEYPTSTSHRYSQATCLVGCLLLLITLSLFLPFTLLLLLLLLLCLYQQYQQKLASSPRRRSKKRCPRGPRGPCRATMLSREIGFLHRTSTVCILAVVPNFNQGEKEGRGKKERGEGRGERGEEEKGRERSITCQRRGNCDHLRRERRCH